VTSRSIKPFNRLICGGVRSARRVIGCGSDAGHQLPRKTNLNLPESIAEPFTCFQFETGNEAMGAALEINFALWIMIGCAIAKADQFLGFVN
jgi:hypothetical protein